MERPKNSPRGTYDLLPPESIKWALIEDKARKLMASAGFSEIRTPIFESTEIFARAAGESSDIVNKEMYTFDDRSGRSITLRPEGTAGVVRAFLSNGMDRLPKPVKLWYLGPMFRYERSQTGRFRQFTQLGLEVYGSASVECEFEGIVLAWQFFTDLGLKGLVLEINSVGDAESRAHYSEALRQFLDKHQSDICPDCQRRTQTNPLRVLDCKVPADQKLYEAAPKLPEYLNEASQEHLKRLISLLDFSKIPYKLNESLVRGLDYYTKTVFEIKTTDERLGTQSTVCAGGRYDALVSEFGGPQTPAFGWALGMERLAMLLPKDLIDEAFDCFVIYPSREAFPEAFKLVSEIRKLGLSATLDYEGKTKGKQFEIADKLGAKLKLILQPEEGVYCFAKPNDLIDEGNYQTMEELLMALEC